VKLFAGLEGRKARFNSPAYWSPEDGHYLGIVGINGEWLDRAWEKYFGISYGLPLGGEAERSYSANAGIKHWFNESLSAGIDLYAQKTQRSGAYRANSALISIQGLW
jgi:hypothetical protein